MASGAGKHDPEKFQQSFDSFQNFVQSPAGSTPKPILNGFEIMNIFKGLNPSSGYIKEVQQRLIEMQDTGEIDISYIKMQDGPERKNLEQVAKNQAIEKVKLMAPGIIEKYKETPKMSKNWFKKVISQSVPAGAIDSTSDSEIVKGPQPQKHPYEVGTKIRDRRKGMANPQEYGIIRSTRGNKMVVEWNPDDKGKKQRQVFDLVEDTADLAFLIAEV
jgi:hypothetical protein